MPSRDITYYKNLITSKKTDADCFLEKHNEVIQEEEKKSSTRRKEIERLKKELAHILKDSVLIKAFSEK